MKKIWCIFSVDNDYNQPAHNLECWFDHQPTASDLSILSDSLNRKWIEKLAVEKYISVSGYGEFRVVEVNQGQVI